MNKKLMITLGGILGLIIIVVGFLLFLNGKNKSSSNQTASNQTADNSNQGGLLSSNTGTLPSGGILSKVKKISDSPVVAPVLSLDGKAAWFFTPDGHLYKINLSSGLKQEFLLPSKIDITDAIWPGLGNDFIIVSGSGSAKTFNYYNNDLKNSPDQKFATFPNNVRQVDFLQDGKHIAYTWITSTSSMLAIANYDLKGYENLVALPSSDLTVKVSPSGVRAFLYNANNPQDGTLYYVSFKDKKLITLHTSTDNSVVWSSDGKSFIYNRDSGDGSKNNKLWLGDTSAITNKDLAISGAVNKSTFDRNGSNIYVAVPNGGSDDIWRIDTLTLVKTKVFNASDSGSIKINAKNLFVSEDGATLYFKNDDGYLYSVPIK
ncbi:MAG: hypothetical protein NVSMB66_5210 [Candidatus Doudnabacteria bacterium]